MKTVRAMILTMLVAGLSAAAATHPGFLLNQQEIDQLKIIHYRTDPWTDASIWSSGRDR